MRRIIWASGIFLCLLLSFLLFYRPKPLAVRKELEVKSELHKVKRITGPQVEGEALRLGDSLVNVADSLLRVHLTAAFNQPNGLPAALAQYPPQNYSQVQAGAQKYSATLTRQAQTGNLAVKPTSQVQPTSQTQLLYTRPIFINNAACLRCHGRPDTDIATADLAVLKKSYPSYNLTGYKSGDQIGQWQITFIREPILKALSGKSRKSLRPR